MNNFNFNEFPPNIDPQIYAWIACIVGSACVGDFTALEQNTLGNWLILVGQFLETTAAQQQLIENRNRTQNQNFCNNNYANNERQQAEINFLLDAVAKIHKELNNLKKN